MGKNSQPMSLTERKDFIALCLLKTLGFFSSFQSQIVAKLKKEVVKDHCLVATTENIKNSE